MNKNEQGFIFLVTLLSIGVISLLLLTSMQHFLLYHKVIHKQEVLQQNFYQLEDVAWQLAEKNLSSLDEACVLRRDAANQTIQDLVHHKACSLVSGSSHYRYLVEDLGGFACLVAYDGTEKKTTYHRRISLMQTEEGVPVSLLQIRFISVGPALVCLLREKVISLGLSSWRYLPSI